MKRKLFSFFIIIIIFIQLLKLGIDIEKSNTADDLEIYDISLTKLDIEIANKLSGNSHSIFTENHGQLKNDEVRFYSQGGGLWFTDDGVWFELREKITIKSQESEVWSRESRPATDDGRMTTMEYKRIILKQEFLGANSVRPIGREKLNCYSNFFYGNQSSKWYTNVPNYHVIYYENLFDGIDVRYYTNEKGLKYDFIVHPGVDISQIRIKWNGIDNLEIDDSRDLVIENKIRTLIDSKPLCYQDINEKRYFVDGRFRLFNKFEYGFEISEENRRNETLIIDPEIKLEYSTYLGGTNDDFGREVEIDSTGNIYVTGWTDSLDFPTTPGANDTSYNGGTWAGDFFVVKLEKDGSGMIYSTYIGGTMDDVCRDLAVDTMGNAYVVGETDSFNFPNTTGAFNTTYNGGDNDGFIIKLSPNGSKLIYSTFIGGNDFDRTYGIAVDSNGNAFVTGSTSSTDFPTTKGAYNTSFNVSTVFALKLNKYGSALIFSTFIGGSGSVQESIAIDSIGNSYITCDTFSPDFPTTPNAFDRNHNGHIDVIVLKLNWNGSKLLYSTFIGGDRQDQSSGITIDSSGNAYVTGRAESSNFPTTQNAFDRTFNGDRFDTFTLKLNGNGSALIYSTFVGGTGTFDFESGQGIAVDSEGYAIVAGYTYCDDFPTTTNALDNSFDGIKDGFLYKLSPDGSQLVYSSFIGGNNREECHDIVLNPLDEAIITGHTNSLDFPTTINAINNTLSGGFDCFVQRISFGKSINISSISLVVNNTQTSIAYSRLGPYTFRVNITDTISILDLNKVQLYLDPLGTNIQLIWNRSTNQFLKINDPNNFVALEPSSKAYNTSWDKWIIDFNITFNWTYPDEELHDVFVYTSSIILSQIWKNATGLYQVENDLMFDGKLSVKGENDQTIANSGLVRGGEKLNWTRLTSVYEGTSDIYPPANEINITIWDELSNSWEDSPPEGEPFNIETLTPNTTNTNSYTYIINISGIPPECDKTNETFTIMIDGNNVTFSDPTPNNTTWQTESSFVPVGITITDIGGGDVKGSSVKYSYSTDNQISWSNWKSVPGLNSDINISPKNTILLKEGTNNFVKWHASDSVGNGPTESETYRILVDISNVEFTNPIPLFDEESATEKVQVGITISDKISGVNGSSIEYSISSDNGTTWSSWAQINKHDNKSLVNITLNLTFPNGTGNRIKWRASDIAGNDPTESMPYKVIINTWLQTFIPKVKLFTPENGSIIPTTSVELSWLLKNKDLVGVNYDILLDTLNPPVNLIGDNFTDLTLKVTDLSDGETYYWTVIPKLGYDLGWCISGIWSFSINTSVPYPTVQLISPENNSIITSPRPTFQWSVEYEGTEKLSYDVYLGMIENSIEFVKSSNTYYLPENILEDNTTYYWKIIPWAGNIKGEDSETWSFTVKKDYIPKFGINLTIDPSEIELEPGGMTTVKAKVTNLGELVDIISLSVEIPLEADVGVMVNEPINLELAPEDNGSFNITITTTEDIKQNEIILTIVAVSEKASEYGKIVEKREELLVKIIKESEPGKEKSESNENYWIYLIVIIIIILIIVTLYLKRKKQTKQEPPSTEDAVIETTSSATTEKPQEQPSTTPTIAQPPTISTQESEKKSITPGISAPELPSLSTESHEVTPQPIPEVQPKPQLPPAKPQISTQEPKDETPTTTLESSTETPENSSQSEELNEDLPKSQD